MIQQDTLQLLHDSAKILNSSSNKVGSVSTSSFATDSLARLDSLARVDSLATADSLHVVDSIRTVIRLTRGFVGTPHPSLAANEAWVFIVLLSLFFFLVVSISRSGSLITETVKNFFQTKERSSIFSKATVNDFQIKLFLVIFSIGVLSLYAYYLLHKPGTEFSIFKYGLILLITFAFFGLKSLIFSFLGYIFLDQGSIKMAKEGYFNIVSLIGMLLFPLLVFQIYTPFNILVISQLIGIIVGIIGYSIVIFKLFQIFFHKIVVTFYILLYLCTLEFLPLAALYLVYQLLM